MRQALDRLLASLGLRLLRLASRDGVWLAHLDFPPARLEPRYGYGRPEHARLASILGAGEPAYRRNLERIAGYGEDLLEIPRRPTSPGEPYWLNQWLPGLDSASLYAFVRDQAPARYVEIGSGLSTMFVRRAIRDGGLSTRVTSIDPAPRAEVDALCDTLVREPLETTDLAPLLSLSAGDVLFVDGSHRVFTNSDPTVFFLDVLPELPEGVLVGVHDILLPEDYLPMWTEYLWSEQYLMASYLLAGGDQIRLELAASYAMGRPELAEIVAPLWGGTGMGEVDPRGFALWFTTTNR